MTRFRNDLTPACGKTVAVGFALLLALGGALGAQPFGAWTVFSGNGTSSGNGYLGIPHDPALNPTGAITIEAWVSFNTSGGQSCRSIIGKNYLQAYWVGGCRQPDGTATLRSYLRGSASQVNGGVIPADRWTHVAVTSDGTTRKHYINGELIATHSEGGALTTSTSPVWIGGDVSWVYSPNGSLDEVRLWNVARTIDQIRADINVHLGSPQAGLVAVWEMGGPNDSLGHFNGAFVGSEHAEAPPAISTCGVSGPSGPASYCLQGKFDVVASFRVGAPGTAEGTGMSVDCPNAGSGLFWFFDPSDWEVLVKVIDGCPLNNRWWVFSAATTDVFYRLSVTDVQSGATKIYFNYPGSPAPAVTDTDAFPCP
jgi:hypothetical protein